MAPKLSKMVMKAAAKGKAKAKPKAKAKAKAEGWAETSTTGTARIDHRGLPVACSPAVAFSVFVMGPRYQDTWSLIQTNNIDAQSFIFNYLQEECGMSMQQAMVDFGDYYLATIGGKKIPKRAILKDTVEHMSHVQVVCRRRGGMQEGVVYINSWRFICSFNLDINSS